MTEVLESLESHRREMCAYAYRMLGSSFEAEDAVQETFTRAWTSYDKFEGRSSLRTWLYRIATNVCLDMLDGPQRRARPMDMSEASTPDTPLPPPRPDYVWIEPIPDAMAFGSDPGEHAATKDSVRLAFVAAIQHLPARQRAILLMREVLRFSAAETADALEITVAAVNSGLQRARATLATVQEADPSAAAEPLSADTQRLVEEYMQAFQAYDMPALTALLRKDVALSMPPFDLWVTGPDNVAAFMQSPGPDTCRGSRLVPVGANGMPAFAQYKPTDTPGLYVPWAINILEIADNTIVGLNFFLDTDRLFPLFNLPMELRD